MLDLWTFFILLYNNITIIELLLHLVSQINDHIFPDTIIENTFKVKGQTPVLCRNYFYWYFYVSTYYFRYAFCMILVFSALLEFAFVNGLTRMELERRKKWILKLKTGHQFIVKYLMFVILQVCFLHDISLQCITGVCFCEQFDENGTRKEEEETETASCKSGSGIYIYSYRISYRGGGQNICFWW